MKQLFFRADAHEGCVWVAAQQRLYFTTTTDIPNRKVDLCYLDFGGFSLREMDWWAALHEKAADVPVVTFLADLNMANAFCLSSDASAILVAEQGDDIRPSLISRIDLFTKERTVLVDHFNGKPFNSLNKVKVSKLGHLIFTDPDYGFRQGFRPPPVLPPSLYVKVSGGEIFRFQGDLKMPHGIVLNEAETQLFVTDTSAEDGQGDELNPKGRQGVYQLDFDAESGVISGDPVLLFEVDKGVPDGSLFSAGRLLTAAGDGVYVFDPEHKALHKILLPLAVYNLCTAGPAHQHLFATADEGVYLLFDWQQ